MGLELIVPVLGIMTGIIVPVAVFIWLYFESKDKNKTILEISKNISDPSQVEDLINLLDERKKEPIDYRRTGVVTLFVGIGLFLFGVFFHQASLLNPLLLRDHLYFLISLILFCSYLCFQNITKQKLLQEL